MHIVSFDVPYPPNYGGVIDVYFKIKTLREQGIQVHLHCFEYGRSQARELDSICAGVHYYPRKKGGRYLLGSLPYIAATRSSEELMKNICKNDYPVLFEGLHCCFYLDDKRLRGRKKIVRMHNIEHDYYRGLARVDPSFFKRWYFGSEAKKLEKFERVLSEADHIIAISPADAVQLSKRYKTVSHIMAFHPDERVGVREGRGEFALYHGNLGIGENNEAALFLVNKVFSEINIPLLIAGNQPSAKLLDAAKKHKNIQIRSGISTAAIYELIKDAQVNVLPTFQATGIKLKLLAALYNGRHCLVNTPMIADTGLAGLCSVCDSAEDMQSEAIRLFEKEFDRGALVRREEILLKEFSNRENVKKITALL